MAAKSYVLGFARRPLTAYDPTGALTCLAVRDAAEPGERRRGAGDHAGGQARHPRHLPPARRCALGRRHAGLGRGPALRLGGRAGRRRPASAPAEFYRSAYELVVEDPRTVTLRFDKVTFDYASVGDFQPLPAHIERARWEADPRGYRNRTAYDTETANPASGPGPTASRRCSPARA